MSRKFTGRHMLAIMLAFFGVVIAVNFTMATFAARTFGGTVVDNSYVASQRFNSWLEEGRAQERLGWNVRLRLDSSRRIAVALEQGAAPLEDARLGALARHPLGRAAEVPFTFRAIGGGRFLSEAALPPGRWIVHLEIRRRGRTKRLIETLS